MTEAPFCFTHKTPCNSVNFDWILTKFGTDIGIWTTKTCSKISVESEYWVSFSFLQSVQKDKQRTKKIRWLLSREQPEGSYSNFECGFPSTEVNFIVNLVPFEWDITEQQMSGLCCSCQCTGCIYTYSICIRPVFLGHTTHYHVSWYNTYGNSFTCRLCSNYACKVSAL